MATEACIMKLCDSTAVYLSSLNSLLWMSISSVCNDCSVSALTICSDWCNLAC